MGKHQPYELKQMQSLPLDLKVRMTKDRIRQWYEHYDGKVYVSFSGGKDSTVLLHIAREIYPNIEAVFCNTGLEYPEIQRFAMSQQSVTVVHPKMRFTEVIQKYGYPVISKEVSETVYYAKKEDSGSVRYKKLFGELTYNGEKSQYCVDKYKYLYDAPFDASAECCRVMKKAPLARYEKETGNSPIIATMATESQLRKNAWLRNGCNAFEAKHPKSTPMAFWAEQDVLHYLKKYNVPYCHIYGDIVPQTDIKGQMCIGDMTDQYDYDTLSVTGVKRTGCIFCMFGCHLDAEPNRFQRLKQTHPKQYEYCIGGGHFQDGKWMPNKEGLGLGYVLDFIGVKY